MTNQTPRLPEPGEFVRGIGTLVRTVVVPPPPQPPPLTLWVFESVNAQMRVLLHGEQLTEGSTYTDFYGKETSVIAATTDAKKYAKRHHITAKSEIEVCVARIVETVARVPLRYPDQSSRANFYDRTFLAFEDGADAQDGFPREWRGCQERVETVVWSSKGVAKKKGKP
jgi:hypothetical protein